MKKALYQNLEAEFVFTALNNSLYNISKEQAEAVFPNLWEFVAPHLESVTNYMDGLVKLGELSQDIQRETRNALRPYLKPGKEIKVNSLQDLIDLVRITPFTPIQLKELLEMKTKFVWPDHILQSKKEIIRVLEATRDTKIPITPHFFGSPGEC